MTGLVERIRHASEATLPGDYVRDVKTAVIEEIRAIDATATVEDTTYFNHSAIPDLVLSWADQRESRQLFLRGSYAGVIAGRDVEYLGESRPVVMALSDERADLPTALRPEQASGRRAETLVTDSSALESLSEEPVSESPLAGLVRANFLRGGKGHIDEEVAGGLVRAPEFGPEATSFVDVVRNSFNEAAATRIERSAGIMDLALGRDLSELEFDPENPTAAPIRGVLSKAEIATLIPWLLRTPSVTQEPLFWRYVGSMMTFKDLENIATDVADLDMSALIRANSARWVAGRSYIGVRPTRDAADGLAEPLVGEWSFRGGLLGLDVGAARIQLATDGRRLKGRPGSSSARWESVREVLSGSNVVGAQLRGVTKAVTVTANAGNDIRDDIERFAAGDADDYFVDEVKIQLPATEELAERVVTVSFSKAFVTAEEASLTDLVDATTDVLGFRELAEFRGAALAREAESPQ
ncbi:hypothetical protein [Isoptericola sp. NPDC019482]|uniref:hypothetical protein n=1 Tax=Isoptericola sp. NPDC019482 TaxID=3154688 RepID=UPI003482DFE5